MSDKLNIKGTITIKSSKSKTPKKKGKGKGKKKTSKLKPTNDFMTGNQGKIFTKEEFGQPAYTQSALLNAMTLRQQPSQASEFRQINKPQQSQQLQQPQYYQLEDLIKNQNLPSTSQVLTTKEELIKRTMPLLESDLRYQLEEQQGRTQFAINKLEEERQFARINLATMEEERKQSERQYKESALKAKEDLDTLRLNAMQRLQEQTNFFEDELRNRNTEFQRELNILEQKSKSEKDKSQVERISSLSTATLKTEVGKEFMEQNPLADTNDMRRELLRRNNLLDVSREYQKKSGLRGRPTMGFEYIGDQSIQKNERVSVKEPIPIGGAEEIQETPYSLSSEEEM